MRVLKVLLIIILALAALAAVLWVTAPPRSEVQRSLTIEASPEVLWPMVSSLRATHTWSPWKDKDPGQENTWEGEDGAIGSVQKWKGDTVGVGSQEIVGVVPQRSVRTKLVFQEPFEAQSDVSVELEPVGDATKVTWTMEQENEGLIRLMARFYDMDQMVGPDFEEGLANLKKMAEAEAARLEEIASRTFDGYLVEEVEVPATIYIGKRAKVRFKDMERHIGTTMAMAGRAIGTAQLKMSGPPAVVYFLWDEEAEMTDMMPSFPVKGDATTKLPGLDTHEVPAGRMLQVVHEGAYDELERAHGAVHAMIEAHGAVHHGQVVESYVQGPPAVEDPAEFVTVIQYMIK